jgi:hypothetical protein
MQWQFIVALVVAIPVILFPVAFLWYLNVGGLYTAVHEAQKRKAARREETKVLLEEEDAEKELVGTKK